jgi:pilus assembly protein Flp/PilA
MAGQWIQVRMSYCLSSVRRLLTNEDGPTAVEYAVMTALIVAVCMNILAVFDSTVRSTLSTVNNVFTGS